MELCPQKAAGGGPLISMMYCNFFRESPGRPPFHARRQDRDVINPSSLYCNIATDLFETLPTKKLTGTGNVFDTYIAVIIAIVSLSERRAHNTDFLILIQF